MKLSIFIPSGKFGDIDLLNAKHATHIIMYTACKIRVTIFKLVNALFVKYEIFRFIISKAKEKKLRKACRFLHLDLDLAVYYLPSVT